MLKTFITIVVVCVCLVGGSNVPTDKVIGGESEDAMPGDYPYFVAVVNKATGQMVSAGVLLQSQVVLTLGSSYTSLSSGDVTAILGANNRSLTGVDGKEANVTEIVIHPEFSSEGDGAADVALLKLDKPAELCPNVQPLGLETIRSRKKTSQRKRQRTKCTVYGFLRRSFGDESVQKLQKFGTNTQRPETCQVLSSFNYFPWKKADWTCAINDAFTNTCPGNGGEPLMCGSKRRGYELIGLVPIRSPMYCSNGFAVFTRLSGYYDWIMEKTNMMQPS